MTPPLSLSELETQPGPPQPTSAAGSTPPPLLFSTLGAPPRGCLRLLGAESPDSVNEFPTGVHSRAHAPSQLLSPYSPGRGGCARGAGSPGLHRGRDRGLLLSGQDDVSGRRRQRGRRRSRQPGGDSPVRGGSWTLHIIQHPPGLRGISFWGLAWRYKKGTSFPSPG